MQTGNLAADPAAQKEYQLLKVLAEHYFGSMMVTDSKGRFLYVNDGCCKLLGIDRETLLNISIYDTLHDYCHATSASSIKTLETKQECLRKTDPGPFPSPFRPGRGAAIRPHIQLG